MSAFTPGPWIAKPHGCIVGGPFHQYTNGLAQSQIASFLIMQNSDAPDPEVERNANTRLAAAAPALYAKVQQYASECGECEGRGFVVKYHDPYMQGDATSPERHDCEACADIRELLRQAGSATP